MFRNFDLINYAIKALVLVTALPIHECAHAWVASLLGVITSYSIHYTKLYEYCDGNNAEIRFSRC